MGLAAATRGQVAKNNYQNYQQYKARQLVTQVITRGAPDRGAWRQPPRPGAPEKLPELPKSPQVFLSFLSGLGY